MEITFRYTRDFSVLFMVTDNKKQSYVVLMKKFVRETQLLEYTDLARASEKGKNNDDRYVG